MQIGTVHEKHKMPRETEYQRIAEKIRNTWLRNPDVVPGTKLPTERQMQAQFEVGRSTVSRALALLAAENLIEMRQGSGVYVRNTANSHEKHLLGFITPCLFGKDAISRPVLSHLQCGLQNRAEELGYQLLTASAQSSVETEELLTAHFLRLGVKGLIIYPVASTQERTKNQAQADYLARRFRHVPIVLTDLGTESWNRNMVVFDNFTAGRQMTRMLLQKRRRNILFMHMFKHNLHLSIHERASGYRAEMKAAGLDLPESYLSFGSTAQCDIQGLTENEADYWAKSLLQITPLPNALIAWEDSTAILLIRALQRTGVRVPEDIIVCGFDNLPASHFFTPPFPTTEPDFEAMGETAIQLLHQQIIEPATHPRTYLLPVPLLWREPEDQVPSQHTGYFATYNTASPTL